MTASFLLALIALLVQPAAAATGREHSACGVKFRAGNWLVKSDPGRDKHGKCFATVAPPGLRKLLESEREVFGDGPPRMTDRYTIRVIVTGESAEKVEETYFWQVRLNPTIRYREGWRIAEDRDHSDRMYFEEGGYCCLSWMPTAILSQGGVTAVVIAGGQSADKFDEIVETLRLAPPN